MRLPPRPNGWAHSYIIAHAAASASTSRTVAAAASAVGGIIMRDDIEDYDIRHIERSTANMERLENYEIRAAHGCCDEDEPDDDGVSPILEFVLWLLIGGLLGLAFLEIIP